MNFLELTGMHLFWLVFKAFYCKVFEVIVRFWSYYKIPFSLVLQRFSQRFYFIIRLYPLIIRFTELQIYGNSESDVICEGGTFPTGASPHADSIAPPFPAC